MWYNTPWKMEAMSGAMLGLRGERRGRKEGRKLRVTSPRMVRRHVKVSKSGIRELQPNIR
jgi:hypothetical protein